MQRLYILGGLAVVACFLAVLLAFAGATDFSRDLVGFLSLFLTVLGLGYTVYQVTLIEAAARAAEKAANEAREESRRRLIQFTAASMHRLIGAITDDLAHEDWGKAAIRLDDLADFTAQVGGQADEWKRLVQDLRAAAAACRKLDADPERKPTTYKWEKMLRDLRTRLDAQFGPLQR